MKQSFDEQQEKVSVNMEIWKWNQIIDALLFQKKLIMATYLKARVYGMSPNESLASNKERMKELNISFDDMNTTY